MAFNSKVKKHEPEELDLLPFMNLFSILIPFLLSVAVFEKMGVLELNLPERTPPDLNSPPPPIDPQLLNLTVIITDELVTIGATNGFSQNTYYQEWVNWRSKSDNNEFTLPYNPDEKVISSTDGKEMTPYEKSTIHLYLVEKKDSADAGKYKIVATNSLGEAIVDSSGKFFERGIASGEKYSVIGQPQMRTVLPREVPFFRMDTLSVYDHLANQLWAYKQALDKMDEDQRPADADKIIILAGDEIIYDKIIHLMDAAKYAGFTSISMSLLGS